jgi:hypothetical protein
MLHCFVMAPCQIPRHSIGDGISMPGDVGEYDGDAHGLGLDDREGETFGATAGEKDVRSGQV